MAQRVRVDNVCDAHDKAGKEVAGETVIVGVDGVWYAIEACKTHTTKDINPVRKMCEELGRPIEGSARTLKSLLKLANEGVGTASVHALPTAKLVPVAQPAEPAKVAASNGKGAGRGKGGGKGGKVSAKPRRHHCLVGECPADFTSTTGMLLHMGTKHGISGGMGDIFGLDCPLCGSHADGGKLGVHLQRRHKGMTVTEAMTKARDSGDKHGIAGPVFAKLAAAA
jgi:hypothetical protein